MTNEMIIFNERCKLMEKGVIGTTGRTFTVQMDDGTTKTMQEPEEIHTFAAWKSKGYKVKKGEKAIARFTIWKHSAPKMETLPMKDGKDVEYVDKGKMFMKNACFFTAKQVEAI